MSCAFRYIQERLVFRISNVPRSFEVNQSLSLAIVEVQRRNYVRRQPVAPES